MAKSQTNAATGASQNLINQANTIMPGVTSNIQGLQNTAINQAGQTFGAAQSGYSQQQQTGGYDPTQLANLRTTLSGMQATGGVDPTQLASIRQSQASRLANLGGMEATGGYDPTQLAATLGGYGSMAATGGFTPEQANQFVNQATSGTTSLASNLASAAQRNAAATGGNASSAIADIQRTGGAQAANATTGALTSLNQQINANKLAGLGGLGTTEQNVAAARQGVAGLETGVTGQQGALEQGVAGLRQGVSGLQSGLESGVAQGVQGANAGMAGLYNTATGQITAQGQQLLQSLGLQFGTEAQGAQILQELSKNPGLFQTGFNDFINFLSA